MLVFLAILGGLGWWYLYFILEPCHLFLGFWVLRWSLRVLTKYWISSWSGVHAHALHFVIYPLGWFISHWQEHFWTSEKHFHSAFTRLKLDLEPSFEFWLKHLLRNSKSIFQLVLPWQRGSSSWCCTGWASVNRFRWYCSLCHSFVFVIIAFSQN